MAAGWQILLQMKKGSYTHIVHSVYFLRSVSGLVIKKQDGHMLQMISKILYQTFYSALLFILFELNYLNRPDYKN